MGSGGDNGQLPAPPVSPPSAETLYSLGELLPDGLVVVTGDGIISFVNQEACRILECTTEELVGRPAREVLPLADKYGRDWWKRSNPPLSRTTEIRHRERLLVGPHGRDVLVTARHIVAAGGDERSSGSSSACAMRRLACAPNASRRPSCRRLPTSCVRPSRR